jgi:hypothetical protein
MRKLECLDGLNGGGWGVFIASTTIPVVAVDGHTGQSGGAPDTTLFTVRCVTHQPTIRVWSYWPLKSFVFLQHRTVRWHTRQSGATCLHSLSSDFWYCRLCVQSCSRPLGEVDCCSVGSPDNVRCATGCANCVFLQPCRIPPSHFLYMFMWTLCTWEKHPLGKLVSPYGLWWTSNTKIDNRKCWGHFPFRFDQTKAKMDYSSLVKCATSKEEWNLYISHAHD